MMYVCLVFVRMIGVYLLSAGAQLAGDSGTDVSPR